MSTTAPCTLAIYATAADRTADATRLDTTPTAAPTNSQPLVQLTTVPGQLTVAVGEALNAATLYLRVSAATDLSLVIEEA
ncbi:hypothetical protein [Deinococcus sp. NW-56]|uniref:hypothetical protein n=1 Tax=Deinococcus sp. NW-56 TaxID=2080419 RepID=UPI001F4451B1|nr:hypothetical protein [Deinococcus sp. NW-56]